MTGFDFGALLRGIRRVSKHLGGWHKAGRDWYSAETAKLARMTHVLPPPRGNRRLIFCGKDDKFWTTPEGDITTELRKPKRSIWSSFKEGSA